MDAIVLAVVSREKEGTYGYKITQDVRKVIDVPGVPAQAAWTEQVPVQRYIRYTEEELAAREKERQQAEEAARLPETIASLTCQLTDLQLALCELYEGGGV